MPLTPATRLGPYEIIAPLGAGGMGEVYVARDSRLDRRVALKLVSGHLSGDAQALARFRREAVALAALNHPNIAIVHDIEELEDGTVVLVMELVAGETLAARMASRRMSVEESLQVGAQIAEALEVAHEHGIVHRDVKPGNVMIGARGLVKVLDFGLALRANDTAIAHAAPPAADNAADTATMAIPGTDSSSLAGMVVGSPGYMSPEQIHAQPGDARSDVFAFGCVLYECLAGRRAFAGETPVEILRATLSTPAHLELLPPSMPGRIRSLIARTLEKNPDARPADMRAVRLEIEEALGIRRAAALREGTHYTTPNNLSPEPTSFVGREGVLEECERLLEGTRLLTLLGMGGTGKTRVAQRMASRALDRFPDGVWFVNLTSVTGDAHVSDVAAAVLGVQDEPGRSSLESLIHHVHHRKMLFVLDNCEQVLSGVRALVTRVLAGCPDSRVLATSREPLEVPGETVFVLPTLALPDRHKAGVEKLLQVESVRLFVDRARAAQQEFALTSTNAADVVEICHRLDGIPLALELAAARVRLLGVSQIRVRLGDRFKLLARPGSEGSARQQTVLATIQWSWDHLLPLEQDLLRRLAVFAGGWTLERAAAVVSDTGDEFEVLDVLTRLVERSFVVVERGSSAPRYRLLESVHHFALEKLREHADETLMRERHLKTYEDVAVHANVTLAGPNLMEEILELKPEDENILAALAWCARAPDGAKRGLRLSENICRYWTITGRYGLAQRMLEEALAHDAGNPPSGERAGVLTRLAGAALNLGDNELARRSLEESLAYWRTSDNPTGLPAALGGLGVAAMAQSRFDDARRFGEEGLALYEQRGNLRGIGMMLHNLATIDFAEERADYGRAHYERALALFREVGDTTTEALCLSSLSTACIRGGGDLPSAKRYLGECFDYLARLETPREAVLALEAIVELLFAAGRAEDAARFAGAAESARIDLKLAPMHPEHIDLEKLVARIRAALGAEEIERFMAIGRAMPLAEAVAEGRKILVR